MAEILATRWEEAEQDGDVQRRNENLIKVGSEVLQTVDLENVCEVFEGDRRKLYLTDEVFYPDQWSQVFLRGLAALEDLDGKRITELGTGSGVNLLYFLKEKSPTALIATDINAKALRVTQFNLQENVSRELREKVQLLGGDLLNPFADLGETDVLCGCIPQVVKPTEMELSEIDNSAHYYDPDKYESNLHHLGLGLTDTALRQAASKLKPGARVVLNLGGRPGEQQLKSLFEQNGFTPKVIYKELTQQHAGTSLESLIEVENQGTEFEFFADGEGLEPLTASEAEEKRLKAEKSYHYIYVMEGTKL